MPSPSAVIWRSTWMRYPAATAAATADAVFSMPATPSWRPRWATGRAVSQGRLDCERDIGRRPPAARSGDLECAFDLDRGIQRQHRDADGRTGVPPLVGECRDHQVGSAVHHLRRIEEIRLGIDEAAEPHHARHLVEVADRGLDLSQEVDGAGARRALAVLDRNAVAELALGDELALGVEAELPGNHQQIAGT